FFFSSRRRHTRSKRDWSSDVCSSDLSLLSFELRHNNLDNPPQILMLDLPLPYQNLVPEVHKLLIYLLNLCHVLLAAYTVRYHFLLVPFSPMPCVIVVHDHSDENRKHLLLNIPSVSVIKLRILAMDCLLCRQWTLYHLFYLHTLSFQKIRI